MRETDHGMAAGLTSPNAIVAISSYVARGTVGNRAAAHAIEALGHPVWSVPTLLLPWHPGHGTGTRIDWPAGTFEALLRDLASSPFLNEVGAVLSGYLGSANQAEAIATFVKVAKARHGAIYCCDPVIGNARGRYVPEPVANAIRDQLVPLADVATPNRFELAWLLGEAVPDTLLGVAHAARMLGTRTVVVTSAAVAADAMTTLLVHDGTAFAATHERIDAPNAGTGDLTAGLFLARTLEGAGPETALHLAVCGALEAVAAEAEAGADELPLERIHDRLREPKLAVRIERVS